jgi:AcrR family transcriptional regulator
MASSRRIGGESSETRALLLDAAEQIMKQEGYPAVTTRRLANHIGVSNQLVHYYFRTMDDLFLAVIRRGAARNLRLQTQALAAEKPVRALWELHSDPEAARLTVEFLALTNHRKAIGIESLRYAEQLRALQTEALAPVLSLHGVDPNVCPAVCLAVLMGSLPRTLVMEKAMGVSLGHAETAALVERYLRQIEGRPGEGPRVPRKRNIRKRHQ